MHVYQEDLADGVTSWECELRRRDQCQARVKLDRNDEFLQEVNDHTHPPTQTNVAASIKRAQTSLDTLQQIITGKLEGISEATTVSLPLTNSIRRNTCKQCHRNELPNLLNKAEIPVLPGLGAIIKFRAFALRWHF